MNRAVIVLAGLLHLMSSIGRAEELPLWEAGFGFTGLNLPDYRGSSQNHGYLFPLPYLVYRGDILRSDRKGIYGRLFESDRFQLNFSADASIPVKSERNTARSGMPDLDATLQIGPMVEICFYRNCDADRILQLRLPVRAVLATDFSRYYGIGIIINPQLNFDFKNIGPRGGWNFGFAFGPLFATEQYHNFYYEVSAQYAVPASRPAYDAKGGYSGSLLIVALSKRFERVWFGAFGRYDELSGAVFADSPLVKTNHAFMAGFGLAWVFDQSRTLVHALQ